ncbi:MAG TPA: SPOR domain-containing protein [Kiloniellaceae bacterium]
MPAPSLSVPRAARARRRLLLPLLLVLPLAVGGCDAIYEDTKGWANRLEVSLLSATHDETAPADAPAEEAGVEKTGVDAKHEEMPAPPAVPVEPVTVVALPAPTPPAAPPPAVAAPGESEKVSGGVLAAASEALLANADAKASDAKSADDAVVAVVLHLSSLRSEEAAKRQWSDLQHSFPEPLGPLQAEFSRTDLGDSGTFYRVLAGPLPSRDKATQVCAALKAKNAKQYCRILPSKPKA